MESGLIRVGIDASNIRGGGGLRHLVELLRATDPERDGLANVIVWSGKNALDSFPQHSWLSLRHQKALDGSLLKRLAWQRTRSGALARSAACDVLLVPGGTYTGNFEPFIMMVQNQLVFEPNEAQRYRFSKMGLRLSLLERSHRSALRKAAGIIFLTETTGRMLEPRLGELGKLTAVIPHGIDPCFRQAPRQQRAAASFSTTQPFKFLYVSIIDLYKHQWQVVEAVAELRGKGMPVELDLVGPAYPPAFRRLQEAIAKFDPGEEFIHYRGPAAEDELLQYYRQADAFVFASSCESFGLVLADAMAAALPIACSNRSVLPELLGAAGVYFDPEQPHDIARALESLIVDGALRERCAWLAFERSQLYSWKRCAEQTFSFIAKVAREERRLGPASTS